MVAETNGKNSDSSPAAPRKHVRHGLGMLQGDELKGEMDVAISPITYGLSAEANAWMAGRTKQAIVDATEANLAKILGDMSHVAKMHQNTHRYVRMAMLLDMLAKQNETEVSIFQKL